MPGAENKPWRCRPCTASLHPGRGEARGEVQRSHALINNSAGIRRGCFRVQGELTLPPPHPTLARLEKKLILRDDKLGSACTVHTVPTRLAAGQGRAASQSDSNKHKPRTPELRGGGGRPLRARHHEAPDPPAPRSLAGAHPVGLAPKKQRGSPRGWAACFPRRR